MSEFITKDNERVSRFFKALDRLTGSLEKVINSHKSRFGGERYFTDREVAIYLKVSRRTLQEWRNNGQIAYILLGGKILYAESDIQAMMKKHHRKAWGQ